MPAGTERWEMPQVVTIRDVARAAGVHISTVSRTFSAPHLVNPVTRSRVLAVAAELGYQPNRAARGLITGRTHNVGVLVADIANPFFPPIIKAATAAARARDYSVFLADTDEDPLAEAALVTTIAKQVDGVLLCSPRMSDRRIEEACRDLPLVVVNRRVRGLPAVLMDVASGTRRAVDHLVGLGHAHLLLLGGPASSWSSAQMRNAARAATRAAGVRLEVLGPNTPTVAGGARRAEAVARSGATAVLAYNDLVAIGLIEALHNQGVGVPERLSVVGVDDSDHGQLVRPKLTTVAMPAAAAGRAAMDLLLQIVADRPPAFRVEAPDTASGRTDGPRAPQIMLDTALVVRDSTAPPPAR